MGGDAVAYTGTDSESIATTLALLLDDERLRARLAADALQRAATFTWRDTASAHVRAYALAVRTKRGIER